LAAVSAPLGQLVEIVGMTQALRLVEGFGGTEIYLPNPSRVKAHSPLAQALGVETVQKLAAHWPSSHVMVPRGRGVARLKRRRDLAILEDCKTMSVRKVALKHEMTERAIYGVLERGREGLGESGASAITQGDLFGAE
jgi:Mor family transcriptional regulator